MGSLLDILGNPTSETSPLISLMNMILGLDNMGANLFGSLSDTLGGIFGSIDSISFIPAAPPT